MQLRGMSVRCSCPSERPRHAAAAAAAATCPRLRGHGLRHRPPCTRRPPPRHPRHTSPASPRPLTTRAPSISQPVPPRVQAGAGYEDRHLFRPSRPAYVHRLSQRPHDAQPPKKHLRITIRTELPPPPRGHPLATLPARPSPQSTALYNLQQKHRHNQQSILRHQHS